MKVYKVIKTIAGQQTGQIIDTFDDIEDARECLANELEYISDRNNDYNYFGRAEDAQAELAEVNEPETRESWGAECCDRYADALREGIASGLPFVASSVDGDCVLMVGDRVHYDNYTIDIVEED